MSGPRGDGLDSMAGCVEDRSRMRETSLEQRIAKVLFYGALMFIVVTCIANWPRIEWSSSWVEAIGTWFSGLGSFGAVAAALYIAGSQERHRTSERQEDYSRRRRLIAFKLIRKSHDYLRVADDAVKDFENGEFVDLIIDQNIEAIMERLTRGIRVEPFDPLGDLVFVHEVNLTVIAMEGNIDAYLIAADRIRKSGGRDIQYWLSTAISYARTIQSQSTLLRDFAEKCLSEQ